MISLKQHMEAHGEVLLKTATTAYSAAIAAMGKAGAEAIPHLGDEFRQKLSLLEKNLAGKVSVDQIAGIRRDVDRELGHWGENAVQHTLEKAKEIREIMVAVAAATAALGERDQRYTGEFDGLTERLHSISKLEDLPSIRRSVVKSATELKGMVAKMAEEGEQSISQLRAEVDHYRDKLEESEKREALDPLTGVSSRRAVEAQIESRISWKQKFCLAILDLNGFKKINDTYGHAAGDDVLKQFAGELKALFRAGDVVGRWGGDEFVVVVDTNLEEAQTRMERVRQWAFGHYTVKTGNENIKVVLKASIGIAAYDGTESAVELIARADQHMYSEKRVTSIPRRIVA